MGGCCSLDSLPPVPEKITPDPDVNKPVKVSVARLGSMWGRDYGVWKEKLPSGSDERKNTIWLWFNKSDNGPNKAIIDLENFVRGHDETNKDKGKVLYKAEVVEKPYFQVQHRQPHSIYQRFYGIFSDRNGGGYDSDDDDHYLRDSRFRGKFAATSDPNKRDLGQYIISKWSLNTKSLLYDGNLGRGEGVLGRDPVTLEVFAKGTGATGYEEVTTRHEDPETHKVTYSQSIEKREFEFVDRVEFRLTFKGQVWDQFYINGDAKQWQADVNIDNKFFNTVVKGGFFSKTEMITSTKEGIDPAFAMLLSHLCMTEFSVAEIKNDLNLQTPSSYGVNHFRGINPQMQYYQPVATTGNWDGRW